MSSNMGSLTPDTVQEAIAARRALEDDVPEEGHLLIDGLTEGVLRAVAAGHPDARGMAEAVVALLDEEIREDWVRWYA